MAVGLDRSVRRMAGGVRLDLVLQRVPVGAVVFLHCEVKGPENAHELPWPDPGTTSEEQVFAHQPPQRRRFRTGFLTDGARVTWEYPRESPDGDQMDIVEVMEIRDGLIAHHRVYWGWLAVNMLKSGEHPG